MFNYASDFIVVVTKDLMTVKANTPFIKYLGLMKKDEAVGKHVKNLPFVNSYPKMTDNIIAVLEKQEIL